MQILGVWGGADCSWGAGIWVQADGRLNNIVYAFLRSCIPCVCIRRIRLLRCPPCPPLSLLCHRLTLLHANLLHHNTSRGRHTLYFQPQMGLPQDLILPPEQRGLSLGAGLEGGQVGRGCLLSSLGAPDATRHSRECLEVGSVQVGRWHWPEKEPLLSQVSVEIPLAPAGRVPGCRRLLAGSKLALDALVPEQLMLADRGL